jgi:hypothetical protein
MELDLEVSPKQKRFLDLSAQVAAFIGGVGSGKTVCGAIWSLLHSIKYPGVVGMIAANTYLQLHKSTLPNFFKLLRRYNIQYWYGKRPPLPTRYEEHDNVLSLATGAQILTYSLDNYEVISGLNLGWIWCDETKDTKVEAFEVLIARLRDSLFETATPIDAKQLRLTTTPNGFDYLYQKFADPKNKIKGYELITATSYDNIFLPGYAERLEGQFSKQMAKQMIYGEFVSLTIGRVFEFNRNYHVRKCSFKRNHPLVFSLDFNVAPMAGVVFQYNEETREIWVLDEIWLPESAQTKIACGEFLRKWGKYIPLVPAFEYEGDIAGAHGDTRDNRTDIEIMEGCFLNIRNAVPCTRLRRDRVVFNGVASMNALFAPGGHNISRFWIDPACDHLIKDLEQLSWVPGSRVIDKKTNKELSHAADALRQAIARIFPMRMNTDDYRDV